jgi:hypothetical protein
MLLTVEQLLNKQRQPPSLKSLAAKRVLDYQTFYPEGYLATAIPSDLLQFVYGPSEAMSLFCVLFLQNNPKIHETSCINTIVDKVKLPEKIELTKDSTMDDF